MVQRPNAGADTEGNAFGLTGFQGSSVVRGTWGTPNGKDVQRAGQRDTALDAIFAVAAGTDLRVDDRVTVRGQAYDVVAIVPTGLSLRAHLRLVT